VICSCCTHAQKWRYKRSMNKIVAPAANAKNQSAWVIGAKFKPKRRNNEALLAYTFTSACRVKRKCYYIFR
jgi:hypothetical protein